MNGLTAEIKLRGRRYPNAVIYDRRVSDVGYKVLQPVYALVRPLELRPSLLSRATVQIASNRLSARLEWAALVQP